MPVPKIDPFRDALEFSMIESKTLRSTGGVRSIGEQVLEPKIMATQNPLLEKDMTEVVKQGIGNLRLTDEELVRILRQRALDLEFLRRIERRRAENHAYLLKRIEVEDAIKMERAALIAEKIQLRHARLKMAQDLELLKRKERALELSQEIRDYLVEDVKLMNYHLSKADHNHTDKAVVLAEEEKLKHESRFREIFLEKETIYRVRLETLNLLVAAHEAAVRYDNVRIFEKTNENQDFQRGKVNRLKNGK
ncbi:MAG: hypothetical protein AB7T49_11805 [Oligoflexales bacterium]